MRTIVVNETRFDDAQALHAYLAARLDFPEHYGSNLDALNDCLGDISENTRIYLVRLADFEAAGEAWFDKFCTVIQRAAADNPSLQVVLARIVE